MFKDTVPRKDYESERDARVRAEAELKVLRERVFNLERDCAFERSERDRLLSEERDRSERELTTLLDRLAPPRDDGKAQYFDGGGSARELSSAEIRTIPVVGKRGARQAREAYNHALEREERERKEGDRERRRDDSPLPPHEAAALKSMLGEIVPDGN